MKKWSRLVFSLVFAAGLWTFGTAQAQDTITDAAQFTAVFDQPGLSYPSASPFEGTFQPIDTWFVDFSALTNAIGAVTNYPGQTQNGVTAWPLRLIQGADTGEVVSKYAGTDEVELLRLAAPTGYAPFQTYDALLPSFCILSCVMNPTNYDGLIADGYTFLDPPRVVIDLWVVSAADEDAYFSYSEPQGTGRFMLMSEEEGDDLGDIDPCNITNIFQPFSFTSIQQDTNRNTILAWQACTNFIYGVFSTDELSTNTFWTWRAYLFGQPNSLTWTDTTTTATNIVNRFYRAARKLPVAIAAGGLHSLALSPDGTLWAWGDADDAKLGDQTYGDPFPFYSSLDSAIGGVRPFPVEVADPTSCIGQTISNAVALAGGGESFSVVVDAGGRVWTWGGTYADDTGKPLVLGDGGLRNNLLNQSGDLLVPSPISGVSNVVSVAAGYEHTLALRADGTVWAWGRGDSGQLGLASLDAGCGFCTNAPGQCIGLTQIVAVAAGANHSVALDLNGKVWTWGRGVEGQLGNGGSTNISVPAMLPGISNVITIAGGFDHTMALTSSNVVWTWGGNSYGQLGRTGTVTVPGLVSGLSNVVAIAGGGQFSLAATGDGHVYAWGDNFYGQLGTNTSAVGSTNLPMLVAGISNAVLVSASVMDNLGQPSAAYHSMAVTLDQGAYHYWGWGENDYGQVGNGTNGVSVNQYVPVPVQFCTRCDRTVQLGTSGSFTAHCTGTLVLYFNDDASDFPYSYQDNSGSYTVTVNGVTTNVPAYADYVSPFGVAVGTVTNGVSYTFSASGRCIHDINNPSTMSDANGNKTNGVPWDCSDFSIINKTNAVCPTAQCFSLVGKIQ